MRRPFIYLLIPLLTCASFVLWLGQPTAQGTTPEIFLARVEGKVDYRTAAYVERVISEAEAARAGAVVLELDTPGGSLDSTQQIVEVESNAEDVAIITYVTPRGAQAASAGTFVVMGSDVAAMAPQTRLGAAHPVDAFGEDIPGALGEKATNDAVALITSLAEAHDRNEDWAEDAVRESASVGAEEALELKVIEHVEPDLEAVLAATDGKRIEPKGLTLRTADAPVIQRPMTFTELTGFSPYVLLAATALLALFLVSILFTYRRMRRWRVNTGREGMVGEVGVVRQPVVKGVGGLVFVHGERWRAVPEDPTSAPIKTGVEVEVVGFRNGTVVVRPLSAAI